MTGISFIMSKFSCPFDTCANSTTRRITSNNVDMIPPRSSNLHRQNITPILATTYLLKHRDYSSSTSKYVAVTSFKGSGVGDCGGFDGTDFVHKVKEVKDGKKAINVVGEVMTPYVESVFCALEIPVLYLIRFMAFTQTVMLVAPTTFVSQYIAFARWGAFMLSFLLFMRRWRSNVTSPPGGFDQARLSTLDKICILGLFVHGCILLAVACGVNVQSILAVGGGATVIAARYILLNFLCGLPVQRLELFSIGDRLEVGSVGGQVIDMGLTTTSFASPEMFLVVVPHALLFSRAVVNKSWAGWRAMVTKIHVQVDDFENIPEILEGIKNMMKSNSHVYLEREQPYCYVSRVERSFAELTLGCNLKVTNEDELLSAKEDVCEQSFKIIMEHDATIVRRWGK